MERNVHYDSALCWGARLPEPSSDDGSDSNNNDDDAVYPRPRLLASTIESENGDENVNSNSDDDTMITDPRP